MTSILTKNQKRDYVKTYTENGKQYKITATVRYDDKCGNGHNSFAITGDIRENGREYMGGCIHEEIAKHFPELAPFIKWHLCSSDGPIHYIANTLYHASDKDHNGLRTGEFSSFKYHVIVGEKALFSSTTFYSFRNWINRDEARQEAEEFTSYINQDLKPLIVQVGSGEPSNGKPSDIDAARHSAIWPDATLEQLQDEEALKQRLPGLLAEFKQAVESLGFTY